jgi:hypothetical protein
MAFQVIQWRLHLRTKTREKVMEHLQRWEARVGEPITLVSLQRYWKDAGMFVVDFTTQIGYQPAEAIFRTMLAASRIQPHWQTTGPSEYEDGRWEFSGMGVDKARGYELITFEVRNYEPSSWPPAETEGLEPPAA